MVLLTIFSSSRNFQRIEDPKQKSDSHLQSASLAKAKEFYPFNCTRDVMSCTLNFDLHRWNMTSLWRHLRPACQDLEKFLTSECAKLIKKGVYEVR